MLPYLGWGEAALLLVNRLPNNNARVDVLRRVAKERAESAEIADAISHFCDGFNRCSENRHNIMHSVVTKVSEKGDAIQTTLKKLSKKGEWNEFAVSVEQIRDSADDTFRFDRYGGRIFLHVVGTYHHDLIQPPGLIASGQPLPGKPPLPPLLNPQSHQAPKV